jgi:hypothetical protein
MAGAIVARLTSDVQVVLSGAWPSGDLRVTVERLCLEIFHQSTLFPGELQHCMQ